MLQSTGIALILGFWSSLYLLDAFLKTQQWSVRPYTKFLHRSGLSVSYCQMRWYTNSLNRLFLRMGGWRPRLLRAWFTAGVVFGLIAMLASIFLLTLLIVNTFRQEPVEQQVLTPVMPGVNLPASQLWYYLLTLLVCGIVHELGHAIAAVREQVRVNGFGLFAFVLYPGAFVDLSTEHLQIVSPLRQLRIYCAGVWHNFVIVVVALAVMVLLPWLLMPFYTCGHAAVVTHVAENSAVFGPGGLSVGEPITKIGNCQVTSVEDWHTCLLVAMKQETNGHCVPISLISELSTSQTNSSAVLSNGSDCCNHTSNTHLCFHYHSKASPDMKRDCLPARATTDRPVCHLQSDCYLPQTEVACVYPAVDNNTKLLRIIHGHRPPLLFLGHPLDLHYSVSVSNYQPVSSIFPVNLPYILETFCKYLVSLSGALAILNVVPCYALDGQYICRAFVELTLQSSIPNRDVRDLIYSLILLFGTIILIVNVAIAMYMLFAG